MNDHSSRPGRGARPKMKLNPLVLGAVAVVPLLIVAFFWTQRSSTPARQPVDAGDRPAAASSVPTAAANSAAPAEPAAGLKPGEYACYGSGGTIMAGLGFKVDASGRYTDLDNTTSGTVRVGGTNLTFTGGHMDGMTGRDLKQGATHFTIGSMASCERWG